MGIRLRPLGTRVRTGVRVTADARYRARPDAAATSISGCVSASLRCSSRSRSAAGLAAPDLAAATTLSRTTIEQAALSAQTVFVGTVVGTRVETGADGVRTAVTLWVDESLKGDAVGRDHRLRAGW